MSKTKIKNTINNISGELQKFLLKNNNLCTDRKRKNDIIDAILYKLYYTESSMTQEKVAIKLNSFKKNNIKCSRQALVKKEQKLDISFYEKLSSFVSNQIDKHVNQPYTRPVIAVDGVYSTFLKSLSKDGFKTNKKNESTTPLITGLFNVTHNCPITLDLAKTKDERKGFIDFIKNKNKYKNNIFVFDRGYVDKKLFKFMNDNGMFFICRIRDNNKYITKDSDDTTTYEDGYNLRAIRYTVDNKSYYVATNIYDYEIKMIKKIYHDRWTIEEYFKYIKQNMQLAKMNEKREIDIRKSIMSQLIVSQITFLFVNLNKQVDNKLIVNKSVLTTGIYSAFLYKFFNGKITNYFMLHFIKIYIQIIRSNKGKSFLHVCKRSNYRWYFKKHFKNVKSETT